MNSNKILISDNPIFFKKIRELFFKTYWHINIYRRVPGVFKKLSILINDEMVGVEKVRDNQFRRVKELIKHAYNNSPFYRERLSSCGITPDDINNWEKFSLIPILSKKDIQLNLDQLLIKTTDKAHLIEDATGGSTGEPLIFYHDKTTKEWFEACDIFVKGWWGINPWDKKAFLWGADRDIPEMTLKEKLKLKLERSVILNSFNMSDKIIKEYAEYIKRWSPKYLQGYSSSLFAVAQFLKKKNISIGEPEAIRSSAETLYDYQRKLIQSVLGEKLYNFYGSREIPNIAAECPAHNGLHIFSPIRYIEILNKDGLQVYDKPGRIVVTDLSNFSMPFIRYDIGDIGIMTLKKCECGRSFPLLKEIRGRKSDFIQTKDGHYIHGEFFTHLFYGVRGIRKFQIYQKDLLSLNVYIVKSKDIDEKIIHVLTAKTKEKMGKDVDIIVEFVEELPVLKSGKHRFTISEVPPVF